MKKNLISLLAILLAFTTVTGCKGKATGPQSVKGTLEEHFSADSIHKEIGRASCRERV